ncbi:MAG TPA: glycosyltransferase family 2 protein, partial [Bacteroidia bacterium]|nr:glycosyltransferase family 2 protein [Bacteroidia bacterium]
KMYTDFINTILTNEQILSYRFIESPFAHPSVMFKKSLIRTFGNYSSEPGIPEDYELWLRWLEHGVKMEKLPVPVLMWRDTPGRLSRTSLCYSSEAFNTIRMRYLINWLKKEKIPGRRPVWIWGAGKYAKRKAAILETAGIEFEGFIDVSDQKKSGKHSVIHYNHLPPPGSIFIISLVSNRGKPLEIEAFLINRGYRRSSDFVICG